MKYTLIGCGRIAPNHIKAALAAADRGLEIAAICDIVPEKAEALAERFELGDVPRYTDYKKMLADVAPGLVAVATESGSHAAVALDCIAAGCNVIIEKPIALSMADARRIVSAADAAGVTVSTNHQNRFNRSVQLARGAIDDGRLGRLLHGSVHVLWGRDEKYYASGDWRGTWAEDGGTLMNQCIHGIDLLGWLMGGDISEVTALTARMNHPYIEAEDIGMALVKFKSGALGMIEGTTNVYDADMEETLYLFGTDGTVKLNGKAANKVGFWHVAGDSRDAAAISGEPEAEIPGVYGKGHTALYADVIDAIKTGREPYVTARDGMKALETVLAIYKSAAEGRPVSLPLGECSTMDFCGRFDHIE